MKVYYPHGMEDNTLGRYRIVRKLAEGGMGAVYVAMHELMDREVVIKVLLPEMSQKRDIVKRFFNEARSAGKLNHPGIVAIHDLDYDQYGRAYIVMERLHGENLQERLDSVGAMSLESAVDIIRQIASAVGAAHKREIIHRDLKPANIFLVRDPENPARERVKVLDFGLAKLAVRKGTQLTKKNDFFGTPAYMAPEQCQDVATVGHHADIYAIGCMFYACLCGHPPFRGGTVEVLFAHMREAPPRPDHISPGVPGWISDIVMQLLEKRVEDRIDSCAALVRALDSGVQRASIGTVSDARMLSELATTQREHSLAAIESPYPTQPPLRQPTSSEVSMAPSSVRTLSQTALSPQQDELIEPLVTSGSRPSFSGAPLSVSRELSAAGPPAPRALELTSYSGSSGQVSADQSDFRAHHAVGDGGRVRSGWRWFGAVAVLAVGASAGYSLLALGKQNNDSPPLVATQAVAAAMNIDVGSEMKELALVDGHESPVVNNGEKLSPKAATQQGLRGRDTIPGSKTPLAVDGNKERFAALTESLADEDYSRAIQVLDTIDSSSSYYDRGRAAIKSAHTDFMATAMETARSHLAGHRCAELRRHSQRVAELWSENSTDRITALASKCTEEEEDREVRARSSKEPRTRSNIDDATNVASSSDSAVIYRTMVAKVEKAISQNRGEDAQRMCREISKMKGFESQPAPVVCSGLSDGDASSESSAPAGANDMPDEPTVSDVPSYSQMVVKVEEASRQQQAGELRRLCDELSQMERPISDLPSLCERADSAGEYEALMKKAEKSARKNHYGQARKLCTQALEIKNGDARAASVCSIASCALGNRQGAKKYYDMITGPRKNSVYQICSTKGIDVLK
ncbi:MAG: hypothetical protein Tsb0020_21730 [Haliangiales bacterium]